MDLAIGDLVVIGNQVLTVIDIDGEEVSFRLDSAPPPQEMAVIEQTGQQSPSSHTPPRRAK